MQRYLPIIEGVSLALQEEFGADLLGLLLCGSLAAGRATPTSDVDIFVVIAPAWRQRRNFWMGDVEVELFINPVHQVKAEFHTPDVASTTAMFATGRILYDQGGIMATLVDEARALWSQGRPPLSPAELPRLRYDPTDQLKDAQGALAIGDEATCRYLLALTMRTTLQAHERIQGRWPTKPSKQLEALASEWPDLAALARRVLEADLPLADACQALAELVEAVLAPVGGMAGLWETEPQPIPLPGSATD